MPQNNNIEDRKRKYISIAVTVAIHLVILLFMLFISLKVAKPDELEGGVPVLLGEVPDGSGMGDELPETDTEETEQPMPEPEPEPAPIPEPTITQENEPSISDSRKEKDNEEKKKKEELERKKLEEQKRIAEEQARKKVEEEEAKRQEEARKEAARKALAGKFGNTGGKGSGYTEGEGNQGSANGNSTVGKVSGNAGTANYEGNRTVRNLPKPEYSDVTNEGEVKVKIYVNRAGRVVNAVVENATTTSAALRKSALDAAKNSLFSSGTEDNEVGHITYRFKQK